MSLSYLAAGGMSVVYGSACGRYAYKTLSRVAARSAWARCLLQREAVIESALSHPHIVQTKGLYYHGEQSYKKMHFIPGKTLYALQQAWSSGSLSGAYGLLFRDHRLQAMLMEKLADAIRYCHEQGVVHGDIKPGNILVTPDCQPVLFDFGLAALKPSGSMTKHSENATHEQGFQIFGQVARDCLSTEVCLNPIAQSSYTPGYASADRQQGIVDAAGDWFAWRIVAKRVFTGKPERNDINAH